jgi:hypothetical protein
MMLFMFKFRISLAKQQSLCHFVVEIEAGRAIPARQKIQASEQPQNQHPLAGSLDLVKPASQDTVGNAPQSLPVQEGLGGHFTPLCP